MKKVLSIVAVSAFMLTAGSALAGGPGKRMMDIPAGCNEECQAQLDELQAGQAQQNELLNAHSAEIEALKNREDLYNPWYVRGAFKFGWGSQKAGWRQTGLNTGLTGTGGSGIFNARGFETHDPNSKTPMRARLNNTPGSSGYNQFYTFSREIDRDHTGYIDNETYFGGQGAIGKYLFNNFRVELEYAYQGADLDGDLYEGDVDLHTVMVNAYYEIPITDMFGLYGVVGGGYGNFSMDGKRMGIHPSQRTRNGDLVWKDIGWIGGGSDVFAYKIGAGFSVFFLESRALALDIGYEYLGTTDAHMRTGRINNIESNTSWFEGETDITSIHSHNVVTSLRFMF